jgi:hypothetical protein
MNKKKKDISIMIIAAKISSKFKNLNYQNSKKKNKINQHERQWLFIFYKLY